MAYLAVVVALTLVPILAILLLRVNGAIAFMSLCLGSVLVTYVSSDMNSILTGLSASKNTLTTNQWTQLCLLVTPFLLTLLFAKGGVRGNKRFINFLPAVATGLLFTLLSVPLLTAAMQRHIHKLALWHQFDSLQTAIILAGTVFSLGFLLLTHRKSSSDEPAKHGKH